MLKNSISDINMSEIVIESVHSIVDINTHSHLKFTPFASIGDLVYVSKIWWEQIPLYLRAKILSSFGDHFGYAVRAVLPENALRDGDAFRKFLGAYQTIFSIDNWVFCLDEEYSISGIDQVGIRKLTELKKIGLEDISKNYKNILVVALTKYLDRHKETGVFMSVDNGVISKQMPRFTLLQVIAELVKNPEAKILFLSPWRYEIDQNNEYRVFIYSGCVAAISQKECYKYTGLNHDKILGVAKTIREYIANMRLKIPYSTYVADIWAVPGCVKLVNILPGELWTSTESGLFNWIADCEKLIQKDRTFVKYIDIQSPMIRGLSGSIDSLVLS